MNVRIFAAMIAVFFLCAVAAAQDYCVRTNRRINLRDAASLQSNVLETVPSGTTLQVVGEINRMLRINRNGNEVWMANWVDFSRVQDCGQASSQTGTSAQIDNCCFVDRPCNSDQEWTDGYWAFQNGQCAAPPQSQTGTSTQTQSPAQTDNCCDAGWHCTSDQQWVNGYWAFQNNQCTAPAGSQSGQAHISSCCQLGWNCTNRLDHWLGEKVVSEGFECGMPVQVAYGRTVLAGTETFIAQITASLEYLKSRAPHWYAYIVNGVAKIRGGPWGPGSFAFGNAFNIAPPHADQATVVLAGTLLHEACHVNRDADGSDRNTDQYNTAGSVRVEENICETLREGALTEANPSRPPNPWLAEAIAVYRSQGGQYDFQAAANGQRDRAFWLLSLGI